MRSRGSPSSSSSAPSIPGRAPRHRGGASPSSRPRGAVAVLIASALLAGPSRALDAQAGGPAPDLDALLRPPAGTAPASELRSPLLFADGTRARTAEDWARRRAEIAREWGEVLGPWPPLLESPAMVVLRREATDSIERRRVRLQLAADVSGEGWLLVPEGRGRRPAVLVVYYEPETSVGLKPDQPHRDFGLALAQRGFVTLSIETPGGDAWWPEVGEAVCQPLSFHAYAAANCWSALAALPEVDEGRIGIVGHSYGGKWALFAGALWDKFAAVAVSDPGIVFDESRPNVNYWEPWYLGADPKERRPRPGVPSDDNPRTGAYKALRERGRDLHELHALLCPRPFFVSGGSEDPPERWGALLHAIEVSRVLGVEGRIGMANRDGHAPTPASNAELYAFLERFLKAPPPPSARPSGSGGSPGSPAAR